MGLQGRVVVCGGVFALVPLREIRKRNIRLVRSSKAVMIDGEDKPVYEKFNWDECPKIDQMFDELQPKEYQLEDYLIENVIKRDLMGFSGLGI